MAFFCQKWMLPSPSLRFLWWNLALSWQAWWSWIWQECCVPLKSYPFLWAHLFFRQLRQWHLHVCIAWQGKLENSFASSWMKTYVKKTPDFMIFGNFVERKECFAIISSFKGKSGFLTRRAARSISTFSWPWSCAGFLLCTPRLQFQSLWGLIGFWNH